MISQSLMSRPFLASAFVCLLFHLSAQEACGGQQKFLFHLAHAVFVVILQQYHAANDIPFTEDGGDGLMLVFVAAFIADGDKASVPPLGHNGFPVVYFLVHLAADGFV